MLVLGIDIGTSGVRSAVLDDSGTLVSQARVAHVDQPADRIDAEGWWTAVRHCLAAQMAAMREAGLEPTDIRAAAVDGTSGSMVLVDEETRPVTRALMYNASGFAAEAEQIARHAPASHITLGSNSALARLLRLQSEDRDGAARMLCHQADFILAKLTGVLGLSDQNNALKTGYDPQAETWPSWFDAAGVRSALLPIVVPAGAEAAPIAPNVASDFGLPSNLMLRAGTTDSVAAFLATGASKPGVAVSSLGTTLAIKLLSPMRIDDPSIGLYSHKVADMWLAGGASNSGGGVLRDFFDPDALTALSARIDPDCDSGLDYYPLSRPGERFPINDPNLQPRLSPRPDDDVRFLHGLFQGIARIEAQGYRALAERGASPPDYVYSVGGGARNATWCRIRERELGVPVRIAAHDEASIGAAKLCQLGVGAKL